MEHPDLIPVESGIEAISDLEMHSQPMDAGLKGQLSQPTDIQAAHSFFNGSGQEAGLGQLPNLALDSGLPAEFQTGTTGFGLEGHQAMLPGLEQGAIAGMPPGSEPISPMIQMILKMPGLTGTVASFFEAIMSFLFPADGGFFSLLDPTLWAQTAQQAFGSLITSIADHIPMTVSFMPGTSGLFDFFTNQGMQSGMFDSLTKTAAASGSSDISFSGLTGAAPPDASNYFVNGQVSPGKPLFETGLGENTNAVSINQGDLLAMDNGNSFGPTMGGYSHGNISTDPQSLTTSGTTSGTQSLQQDSSGFPQEASGQTTADTTSGDIQQRGDLLQGDGGEVASADNLDSAANYTVRSGDNLWNIARDNLGSGNRWTEIYDLNSEIIGNNPNLIFSGSELHLPGTGGEHLATAGQDYMVRSGDNLWNIARDHTGAGANWPSIYAENSNVIGANPDLIHPGQHLAVPHGNATPQLAQHHSHTPAAGPGHKVAHHAAKAHPHHPNHGSQSHQPAHTAQNHSQKPDSSLDLANEAPSGTTSETIIKEAQSAQAAAQNEIQKTASLPTPPAASPEPVGLRAVAKSL